LAAYKLALFDLDGTLTKERSAWEYIHRRLGVWEGFAKKYQDSFLRGEIDYARFCQLDAAIWKGMKVAKLQEILQEIPLHDGIEELCEYLRSRGIKLGIISSGLSLLSDWVKERYSFDYAVANELLVAQGVVTGEIKINVSYDQKGEWVQKAQRLFKARKEELLAIGDSTGDVDMFQMAGLSVAFNPLSPRLESIASFSVHSTDLRDLIPRLKPFLEEGEK